jgi:hypothetical protein
VNIYPFIEAERAQQRSVKRACQLLEVSRAACCQHQAGPAPRERADAVLASRIKAVHAGSKGRYGAPRVHAELARHGHHHGRKRVARLMQASGLQGRAAKRWKRTTIADPAAAARADLIRRDFTAGAAGLNRRWCGDITYIPTAQGWLFLATVIDIASRRVAGYAMAEHLRTELAAAALANALAVRDPGPGVIFHADRGSTPLPVTPPSPPPATSASPTAGPGNAGTTRWPRASSARSKANCPTTRPGPARPPAGQSPSTSPGTTAPGSIQHSATRHPPNSKPAPPSRTCRT